MPLDMELEARLRQMQTRIEGLEAVLKATNLNPIGVDLADLGSLRSKLLVGDIPITPPTGPTSGFYFYGRQVSSESHPMAMTEDGVEYDLTEGGGLSIVLVEFGGAWGSIQPPSVVNGAALTATPGTGLYRSGADATGPTLQGTDTLQEDADGMFIRYRQTGIAGTNSGWGFAANEGPHTLRQLPQILIKWKLSYAGTGSPETRFYVCLSSTDISSQVASDAPAASYIGIRFSETGGVGDTNFRFVCDDGGAAPSDVDTGIPVDTDVHYLRITAESATSVLVEMLDSSMTLEASQTFTAASHQLPATTTFMHPMAAQQNLAASQTNDVHLYYCHGVNKA